MRKIFMIALCLGIVPMLFAGTSDADVVNKTVEPTSAEPTMTSPRKLLVDYTPRIKRSGSRDLLWSQIPNPATALGLACQLDTVYPLVADISDDIDPPEQWIIDSVTTWWACWNGFTTWALVPYIDFLVYNDNGSTWPEDSAFVKVRVPQTNYTATSIGTDRYFVEMTLPTPVILPGGAKYWVEVRPCTDFSVNGQTGWMGEVGIGNGQELYFRFPVLAVPDWVTSTTQWGVQYEVGFELYGSVGAAAFWDFETGWQGWTHTNGQVFPAAWGVEPAAIHTPCPAPDDSSMWMDSDASGGGYSDSALSPLLVPNPTMDWLKYGYYNYGGSGSYLNELRVGIKYYTGGVWSVQELAFYPSGETSGPGWDSVDVSAYATASLVQIYFFHDDLGTWGYYSAFDNVSIDATIYVPSIDVGTTAIVAPGLIEFPNTTLNPTATYQNFGTSQETFDVYFEIDSLNSLIYSETANITRDPGMDTTITWPAWTTGPIDGIIYDITAYTVLSGDVNPSNDTLTSTTTTQSAFWKTYATMPQATYYNAAVYSDVTGAQTVWSVGGNPTFTSIFEFDCATESWTTSSATLNHEAQRTAAAVCDGKIYVMGGCDAGFTAHNYCQEYDPVAGTVTDKTPLPTARYFNGALTWNDTLIYVLGGQSSSYWNVIEIYDPANDAWTTATPLPEANRSFACGIQNDTIYVTGGYSASGYLTATRIGVIDSANPQSITWSTGPNIPTGPSGTPGRSRLQGACVQIPGDNWVFYFTCGDDHGVPAYDTWHYDPATAAWVPDLDKTTPISNSQCAVYVPNPFDHGTFFCAGGYNTASGSGTAATEGLVNIGTGIYETPPVNQGFAGFGFAAMANPSKGMISYVTSTSGKVVLKAYDASGRLVGTLVNSMQPAGVKTFNWDTSNIANGVYFLKLDAQGETATQKMILVK